MLARGFYDALAIWPIAVWPVVFSSAFWAFLRLCMATPRYGVPPMIERRGGTALFWTFVPLAGMFDAAVHLYLLWSVGFFYLTVALPIFILGWTLLPALLDDFGPALVLLPAIHLVFAASFLVLLGAADIGVLRAMNAEIYGLLTGGPVAL